ncbi:MAG TPA: DUF1454 domain-containing protein [Proteus sp.]|uniref:DUF1454 family protein n=1 Tax=Proteus hauseri ATCC 700826 TaxID=1354271 RepID=A0AAJ3HVS3_PROHU|nr:DUF1454 family protein [Proteus hauseri]OAT50322.1 hypothetical protein M997_0407 [Proteus hauseri ATCC 700826]QAV23185.1 DUF1454 domain-containing protein [Proteus hauseri]HCH49294.1 DUF1454 domain-containing protein [Proteus sp. (in: enterobacteria)]
MIKKSIDRTLIPIIISIALCLPTSVFATVELVAQKQPSKDDISYLKQDAPVFELTIPMLRANFNQRNPLLFLNEYKIITNNDITIPLVRAATRITPYLYSSAVLERGSEKIKSLQLTLIHTPESPEIEKQNLEIATKYITSFVAQFDVSITPTQIQEVLDLFAFKNNIPVYISHNVGAIRYIITNEGTQLTTFAIEPIKLSLNSNIDSAIP